ncbi:MAG: hypothetical protein ACKOA8_16890, partial [Deltaproteobacteria bacterium]
TGVRLDGVSLEQGMAQVDFRKMAQIIEHAQWQESEAEENYSNLIKDTTMPGPGLGRASMETGFHARLSQKYVIHFHSLASLLIYHELNKDKKRVMDWLKSNTLLKVSFVEACRPGWILSKKVFGDASIYFLESHGIILQGEDDSILNQWEKLETTFCKDFSYPDLYDALQKRLTFEELFEKYGSISIPFRCYFPDIAVFIDRMNQVLKKNKMGECTFPKEMIAKDRDMAELWLATVILYKLSPGFPEVPVGIASTLKDLPTEKIRQQRAKRA